MYRSRVLLFPKPRGLLLRFAAYFIQLSLPLILTVTPNHFRVCLHHVNVAFVKVDYIKAWKPLDWSAVSNKKKPETPATNTQGSYTSERDFGVLLLL
jgi:hypothetical protein